MSRVKMCRPSGTNDTPSLTIDSGALPRVGSPSNSMTPPVALTEPATALRRVDLPAPFGPMTPTISPARTSRETPRSAAMLP